MKGKAKQPRHPVGNGYAQGKETRLRIIEAAIEVFAARGYEEAATRMIADLAAVNLAALNYYFGSKEALYRACAEHIADCASARFRPIAARVERVLANAAVPQQDLLAILRTMLDALMEPLVGVPEPQSWVVFVIREQTTPTPAADIIYDRFMGQLLGMCASVVGRLSSQPADDPRVMLRTLAILGQLTFFRRARAIALRALDWPDFRGERLDQVRKVIWEQIQTLVLTQTPTKHRRSSKKARGTEPRK